ncbi:hypothetical protein H6H01_31260 [Nostoc calcicola FACHB-3891]|nr:hypothetical protein [Nostoc calcicola FACHB-3891]
MNYRSALGSISIALSKLAPLRLAVRLARNNKKLASFNCDQKMWEWFTAVGATKARRQQTAYAAELHQLKALQAKFQSHITKPVDVDALIGIIVQLDQPH